MRYRLSYDELLQSYYERYLDWCVEELEIQFEESNGTINPEMVQLAGDLTDYLVKLREKFRKMLPTPPSPVLQKFNKELEQIIKISKTPSKSS